MKNALTVDLEDYYQVSAFRDSVSEKEWCSLESRVERNTDLLLEILSEAGCKATFFTLGWIAERYPRLVRRVADSGHEIACHSLKHRTVYELSPEEFREDTARAKKVLEDASGTAVLGYRAPSFSITGDSLWALDVLSSLGFTYDSSIFPVKHPNYGMHAASRMPFLVETATGNIVEFPMPTLEMAGMRSPFGGGAYLRLLPYWFTRWGISYLNENEHQPVCVYLHPWEIDPEQPRLNGSLTSRLRHSIGLRGVEVKLKHLLRDFEFYTLGSLIAELAGLEPITFAE